MSVVILALNEAGNLRAVIPAIRRVLGDVPHEILVVDGGSTDGTAAVAQEAGARVWIQRERGFGRALVEGLREAQGTHVVTMDADGSHNPVFIEALLAKRGEADVVVASRYAPGGGADQGWLRSILSRVLNTTYRRVLSVDVRDMSSNFRMYRRAAALEIDVTGRNFEALEEILIKAYAHGFRIAEVPFRYEPRGEGSSKAKLIKFGWRLLLMLVALWRMRNGAFTADYDDRAFDAWFFLQRYWQRTRYARIMEMSGHGSSILDVGCGSSRILKGLPQAVGVDVAVQKLRWVRRWGVRVVRASVTALPFKTGVFGETVFSQVIEHLRPKPQIMAEIARVTTGTLIIGTPDYSRIFWPLLEYFYDLIVPQGHVHQHITHYTMKSFRRLIKAAGFVPTRARYVGGAELIIKAQRRTVQIGSAPP